MSSESTGSSNAQFAWVSCSHSATAAASRSRATSSVTIGSWAVSRAAITSPGARAGAAKCSTSFGFSAMAHRKTPSSRR